jgi:hypothetical protein
MRSLIHEHLPMMMMSRNNPVMEKIVLLKYDDISNLSREPFAGPELRQ